MNGTRLIVWLSAAFLCLLVGTAVAQSGPPNKGPAPGKATVGEGFKLYEELEYKRAAAVLVKALAVPTLTTADKKRGYTVLALCLIALNRADEARAAFRELLLIDRKFQLARTESRRARELMDEVRRAMPVDISLEQRLTSKQPRAGSPITLSIRVGDTHGLHEAVVVHHRPKGAAGYSTVQAAAMKGTDGKAARAYTATISGQFVAEPRLEYYVTAVARDGRVLARAGSPDKPETVVVLAPAKPRSGSVLTNPWFWGGIGAAAIAATVTAVIVTRDESGTARVNLSFDVGN